MIHGGINEFICPSCGEHHYRCEVPGCPEWAIYEGWVRNGMMIQRRRVCEKHVSITIAREAALKEVDNE